MISVNCEDCFCRNDCLKNIRAKRKYDRNYNQLCWKQRKSIDVGVNHILEKLN